MRELERRYVGRPIELRAAGDGGGLGTLHGYAAMFRKFSQNLGGFVEEVDSGAFGKTLGDAAQVMARYNHDDNYLLGTTEAETLRLAVDNDGLVYDVDLPDTTAGRDCAVLAGRKDLRYSSFAFRCIEDEWTTTPQGFPLRRLLAVQLVDVAPVNSPAYLDTSVAMRSLADYCGGLVEETRAGKALSAANVTLIRSARDHIGAAQDSIAELLADVPEETPDEENDDSRSTKTTADTEQRDTHSAEPRSIAALRMQLSDLQ